MGAGLAAARAGILEQVSDPAPGDGFAQSAMAAMARAVGFDGYCLFGVDPSTGIRTVMFAHHGLTTPTELLLRNETVESDANRYESLARGPWHAGVLAREEPRGAVSPRLNEFLRADGYTSELRLAMVAGGRYWGGLNLFRDERRHPFTQRDADLAHELSEPLSLAVRRYQVGRPAAPAVRRPAGVVLFDRRGNVVRTSEEARTWLRCLANAWDDGAVDTDVDRVVHEVAAAAAGRRPGLPLCRVRMPDGEWLVVSASRVDTDDIDVVVVLRSGDIPTVAPAFAAWCGLTARETQLLELLVAGHPTKHLARALALSVLTVNDHLRSIYRKARVRGRDELLALLA